MSQSYPGLEIYDKSKQEWIPIPFISDEALVINIGDCLSEWSQGMLKSTHHRVKDTFSNFENATNISRYSLAYFVSPSMDATMDWPTSSSNQKECDNSVDKNNKVLTYSQWRKNRIQRAMKLLKSSSQPQPTQATFR